MYFRLPNIFVANYIEDTSQTDDVKPEYEFPVHLLNEPDTFEEKVLHAQNIVKWSLEMCPGAVVVSTSFGIQSAVMLHMISTIDKSIPVIWIDTGYLPPETYHYAAQLKALFDLNIHIFQSDISPAHMEAIHGKLWEKTEPNAHRLYGLLRKVIPMRKAQKALAASLMLTGVRRSQTNHRKKMSIYTAAASKEECGKVCPILSFTDEDTVKYFNTFALPPHPLAAQGYTSVGDAHSSRPKLETDKDDRATRFGNRPQQECGLHTETGSLEEYDKLISNAMSKSATDDEDDAVIPVHTLPTGYLVFGRVACKYCRAAKALLTSKGISYTEYLVIRPDEAQGSEGEMTRSIRLGQLMQLVREVTGDPDYSVSTVPQIFFDRNYIGGFSELYPKLDVSDEDANEILSKNSKSNSTVAITLDVKTVDSSESRGIDNQMNPPTLAGCVAGLPSEMAHFFHGRI